MKILWIYSWGYHKTGLVLGVISLHFRVFSEGQCDDWGYFLGMLNFQIFLGVCLIFQIYVEGKQ